MSYYDAPAPGWTGGGRPWDSSRSGNSTPTFPRPQTSDSDVSVRFGTQMKPEDPMAFGAQIEEVDRALENLVKSGKIFAPARRDSMPPLGTRFNSEHEPRGPTPGRHYTPTTGPAEFDLMRSQSAANLQNFYANQRFQSRPSETEQMVQAKRRMAAQRERDLRNYHQEQQFNRALTATDVNYGKERVVSPGGMSDDDRRDLIRRQHSALYAGENGGYGEEAHPDEHHSRHASISGASTASGPALSNMARGPSPLVQFDPFAQQNQQYSQQSNGSIETSAQTAAIEHTGAPGGHNSPDQSQGSPSTKSASFSLFDTTNPQNQSSRTSASSPGGSPPRQSASRQSTTPANTNVAPIGTRPVAQGNPAPLSKRATTPLANAHNYPFAGSSEENNFNGHPKERSASAASNNSGAAPQQDMKWGNQVWGGKNMTSVWG